MVHQRYEHDLEIFIERLAESQKRQDDQGIERSLMGDEVIWQGVFGGRMDDKDHVIECYERHNQEVIDTVPAEQLLVFRPGDGGTAVSISCRSLYQTQSFRK